VNEVDRAKLNILKNILLQRKNEEDKGFFPQENLVLYGHVLLHNTNNLIN
jgi:hypothetical protein